MCLFLNYNCPYIHKYISFNNPSLNMSRSSKKIPLTITNKNYNKVGDAKLFITPQLKSKLETTKNQRYGERFKALTSVGFRGGKHLIELLRDQFGDIIIVLSHENTNINSKEAIINYDEYIKSGSSQFLKLYRVTGQKVAINFLIKHVPDCGLSDAENLTKKEAEEILELLPKVTDKISLKKKRQLILEIIKIIEDSKFEKVPPDIFDKLKSVATYEYYNRKITEFKERLIKGYPETKGKNPWQSWIYNNSWIFGYQYTNPISKQKVGFDQIPDYLFPTINGFLDILEIKTPNKNVIVKDKNHKGSYYWSTDASEAIGQVINYLSSIELNKYQIEEQIENEYNLNVISIKPRAFILIGRSDKFTKKELEAFRKLNSALHEIEVITYDQLLERGQNLITIFEEKT